MIIGEMKKKCAGCAAASSKEDSCASNLLPPQHSDIWTCRYCMRVFYSGKALGSHIKFHYKNKTMLRFTHKKKKNTNRNGPPSSKAPSHRGRNNRSDNIGTDGGSHSEIIDLSRSLPGLGWKLHKKRGSNEGEKDNSFMSVPKVFYDDDDDEDSCDEDDLKLREKLRRYGFDTRAHKIYKKIYYNCRVCNVSFTTVHAALVHGNESSKTNAAASSMEVDQVVKVNDGVAGARVHKSCGLSMNRKVFTPASPPKMRDFDLNEMPPEED